MCLEGGSLMAESGYQSLRWITGMKNHVYIVSTSIACKKDNFGKGMMFIISVLPSEKKKTLLGHRDSRCNSRLHRRRQEGDHYQGAV